MTKTAVVLFNLGGPDSKNAIEPFLFNFFMDRNIINIPIPFRCFLAKFISTRRSKREAGESYEALGNVSPLLTNSKLQSSKLEKELNKRSKDSGSKEKFKTFICMRYWHPMSPEVVRQVRDWAPDKIVLLPLYPQFSTTTTWSSFQQWEKAAYYADYYCPTYSICCYPWDKGYIEASAQNIAEECKKAQKEIGRLPRILFSAHGLPEDIIKSGDPYQWQCEQSAEKIAARLKEILNIKELDWLICYQSRVGPKKWIGPSTENVLKDAGKDQTPVLIYPHAFTQEHVETLVELDEEYAEIAHEEKVPGYFRAQTVGVHSDFITGMADMVQTRLKREEGTILSDTAEILCPNNFDRCCMRDQAKLKEPYQEKHKKAA